MPTLDWIGKKAVFCTGLRDVDELVNLSLLLSPNFLRITSPAALCSSLDLVIIRNMDCSQRKER